MPKLVDTTIRLLSQEPLAGNLPTAEVLRVAEILDQAGFACLEVSGGGVFDATVRRRVESPWERIRAIKARVSTPLGIALRGRFLVGSRPVGGDIVGRFVACAAENGIDVFRLHDPLNDVSNLREAGAAITNAGGAFHAGLVYSPGRTDETDTLVAAAQKLPELGATRVLVNDPTGALVPHRAQELVGRIREASGLPVGFYVQGSAGVGLASALAAVDAGADLIATDGLPARAHAPSRVRRVGRRVARRGSGTSPGSTSPSSGTPRTSSTSSSGTSRSRTSPRESRCVRPSSTSRPGSSQPSTCTSGRTPRPTACSRCSRRSGASVPRRVGRRSRRRSARSSPRRRCSTCSRRGATAPSSTSSASSCRAATASRRSRWTRPSSARSSCSLPRAQLSEDPVTTEDVREQAEGLAASEEELVLIAMFGSDAEELLKVIRARHSRDGVLVAEDADAERGERIRELVKIVQESGVGEIEIEDEGMRVSVRRADEPVGAIATAGCHGLRAVRGDRRQATSSARRRRDARVESPMVGVFYRAPNPGAPAFVDVGDTVVPGQTLCILEAMKLFNELKAETAGVVRAILAENAQPVEYGQLLFEIEPMLAPPAV